MAEGGNQEFPTVLGPDARFDGKLTFEKGMRLMGQFKGELSTPGRVQIAKEARMEANVEAGSIVIEGEVEGNLSASDRIEMKNTARYKGDLRANKLVVEEGAAFTGHVSVGPEAGKERGPGGGGGDRTAADRRINAAPPGQNNNSTPQPARNG